MTDSLIIVICTCIPCLIWHVVRCGLLVTEAKEDGYRAGWDAGFRTGQAQVKNRVHVLQGRLTLRGAADQDENRIRRCIIRCMKLELARKLELTSFPEDYGMTVWQGNLKIYEGKEI